MTDEQRYCVSPVDQSVWTQRNSPLKRRPKWRLFFAAIPLMQESRLQKFILMHIGGSEMFRIRRYRSTSNTGRPIPIEMVFFSEPSTSWRNLSFVGRHSTTSWSLSKPAAGDFVSCCLPWISASNWTPFQGAHTSWKEWKMAFCGFTQPRETSCFNHFL